MFECLLVLSCLYFFREIHFNFFFKSEKLELLLLFIGCYYVFRCETLHFYEYILRFFCVGRGTFGKYKNSSSQKLLTIFCCLVTSTTSNDTSSSVWVLVVHITISSVCVPTVQVVILVNCMFWGLFCLSTQKKGSILFLNVLGSNWEMSETKKKLKCFSHKRSI